MTILCRVVGRGFELTVCGSPSKEWLDWLRTAEVPLTEHQLYRRQLLREPAPEPAAGGPEPTRPRRGKPPQFDLVDTDEL